MSGLAASSTGSSSAFTGGEIETAETRFGALKFNRAQAITFPRGLLGIPAKFHYCICDFPSDKLGSQFKLLHSLDDAELTFITLPIALDNAIIQRADLLSSATELEIAEADLAALLIVTVHRSPLGVKLSVNARAPVLVDAARRVGVQYVFTHDRYLIQHMISLG